MNFLRIATLAGVSLLSSQATLAHAQGTAGQVGAAVDAYPGDGVRLSESALLHVGVGAEAGYDTNVFYDDSTPVESAMLVVVPFFNISNSGRSGQTTPPFVYTVGASLAYRQYINDDPAVKAQTAFNPTFTAGISATGNKVAFILNDSFIRIEEAPYGPAESSIIRDNNVANLQLGVSPGGGRITGTFRYSNQLEIFENAELSYGNNMGHIGTLDASWKWLPKTALFLRVTGGYIQFLKSNPATPRSDSIPFGAGIGIRGLITPKLSGSVDLGYGTAWYLDDDTQVSGIGNFAAAVQLVYKLGFSTQVGAAYGHGFRNSPILGDYYDYDSGTVNVSQAIGGRLILTVDGRLEYRRYKGLSVGTPPVSFDRNDSVAVGQAKLDFFIQKWFYAGIGYNITYNGSNMDQAVPNTRGVDYVKQQILGRIGFTY